MDQSQQDRNVRPRPFIFRGPNRTDYSLPLGQKLVSVLSLGVKSERTPESDHLIYKRVTNPIIQYPPHLRP